MLNIVIPMAGKGSRFSTAGYKNPKPLIQIHNKHMIEVVINNLKPTRPHKFIFIVQEKHLHQYNLQNIISQHTQNFEIISLNSITDGAAQTVLKAQSLINTDEPLMIANSDQWVDIDIDSYLEYITNKALDGCMLTMKANDPKWSYAKLDSEQMVIEVVEKVVISDEATVGIYNFSQGRNFCKYANIMVQSNIKSNNEFYVAPVYTLMANDHMKIGIYNIGSEGKGMYGLGIPSDLESFLTLDISKKATCF